MTEQREPSKESASGTHKLTTSLRGKRAFVTGGSQRIGRAFAVALAKEGCDVAIQCNRSREAADETAEMIRREGVRAAVLQADFTDAASIAPLARQVREILGGIDILINNAGAWSDAATLGGTHALLEESLEQWERNMAVNCRAPFFLMQHLAPDLRASRGAIVNIVDDSVETPFLKRASHTISKSALLSAGKIAAMSLAPDVRVNSLLFGGILPPDEMSEEVRKKNTWGGVDAAVNALLFLLKNEFISGELIPVRGNFHLRRKL